MKVIAISDLHGYLPKIEEKFDILFICGDICPVWEPHKSAIQYDFITGVFAKWVNELPYKDEKSKVILIAGNHDFVFQSISTFKLDMFLHKIVGNRLVYLNNEEYELTNDYGTFKIFGTPYCKVFGHWAFMRENLEKYYDVIPDGLDFLISHDAADINGLGIIKEGGYSGTNAGNAVLAKYIKEKKPKYYFCGHIHSGNHELTDVEGTKCANVSSVNEEYELVNHPLVIEV